jgi:hypothetical protein
MVPDVAPHDGGQLSRPQFVPPHASLDMGVVAGTGAGVVEVVLGVGVVEVVLGVGVVEVVLVVGTGVVEVGLQFGHEYMSFLHVLSSVRSIVQPDWYPPTSHVICQLSRNAQDGTSWSPGVNQIVGDDANPTDASRL